MFTGCAVAEGSPEHTAKELVRIRAELKISCDAIKTLDNENLISKEEANYLATKWNGSAEKWNKLFDDLSSELQEEYGLERIEPLYRKPGPHPTRPSPSTKSPPHKLRDTSTGETMRLI